MFQHCSLRHNRCSVPSIRVNKPINKCMSFLKHHSYVSRPDTQQYAWFFMQMLILCLKINDPGLSPKYNPNTIRLYLSSLGSMHVGSVSQTTLVPQVAQPGTALTEIMVKEQRNTGRTYKKKISIYTGNDALLPNYSQV